MARRLAPPAPPRPIAVSRPRRTSDRSRSPCAGTKWSDGTPFTVDDGVLQPPALSWAALLQSAQNVRSLALAPWLFIPGLFIVATVLAYNFVGDGLRDAADPYT